MASDKNYEYALDIFGQEPGLHNLYTQISLIYAVPSSTSSVNELISTITDRLTTGLEKLTAAIPWIAGQVVQDPPGTYKIVPLDAIPRLTVKDLRHADHDSGNGKLRVTMDALRKAGYPFSMLHENEIAPRNTLMAPGDVCPVFMVQATLIPGSETEGGRKEEGREGGVVLTFVGLHNVMDMTGFGWTIGVLDRLCKLGGEVTEEERKLANLDRTRVVKLLDEQDGWTPAQSQELLKPPVVKDVSSSSSAMVAPKCIWAYVTFPPSSLTALKTLASSHLSQGQGFVSTDDVLSAFIFQSILRVRLPRLSLSPLDADAPVTFARAIDPRRFIGIHPSYPGVIQNMNYHSYPSPQELVNMPLGSIAADLRAAILAPISPSSESASSANTSIKTPLRDIAYRTRLLATRLFYTPDKNSISVTSALNLGRDVMLSSWAKEGALWSYDFGMGMGEPEAVRRPAFVDVESLVYVMPRREGKDAGAEAVVGLCLREEDMRRLKEDEEVQRWARWVG